MRYKRIRTQLHWQLKVINYKLIHEFPSWRENTCKILKINFIREVLKMFFTFLLALTIVLAYFFNRQSKKKNGFPEPWGLPVVGHLFFLGRNPAKKFAKWKEEYGPVFMLNFAGKRVLVLNDRKSIKEAFGKEEFAGRRAFKLWDLAVEKAGGGIIIDEGPQVEELRQFFLKAFRQHGLQRNKTEEHFQAEIDIFLEQWHGKKGEYFPLRSAFGHLVLNCVWRVLASSRYEHKEAEALLHQIGRFVNMDRSITKLATFAPGLVSKFSGVVAEKLDAIDIVTASMKSYLSDHRDTRTRNEPRNVIDKLLDTFEVKCENADPESKYHHSKNFAEAAIRDIIAGTIETMSNTLQWFVIHGICFPGVVEKLQREIDIVIGEDRKPTLCDKANMPFTEACILEILRVSATPLALPHLAMEDAEFRGEFVQKGTVILGNTYAVHHDPEEWDEPEEFQPERFLTCQGRVIPDAWSKILSFSSGKRSCIGTGIVFDELFLIITNIYQQFSIKADQELIPMDGLFGFTYRPSSGHSNISASPRFNV